MLIRQQVPQTGTRASACSCPSSTSSVTPQPFEIKQADRAKHKAHHSLRETR